MLEKIDIKQQLVNQAIKELSSGNSHFSLRDLSKSVGVSHAAPYKHFKNKDEVLVEIAIVGFDMLQKKLQNAKLSKSHEEYFNQMGRLYLDFAVTHPNHYQLMFSNEISDHAQYPSLQDAGKKCFSHLLEMVMNLQRADFLINGNPLTLAFHIWSSIHGYSLFQAQNKITEMEESESLQEYSTEPLEKWSENLSESLFHLCLKGIKK